MENNNSRIRIISALGLFTAVIIWGLNYIAQAQGARNMGPFTFNFFRMFIGSLVVFPMVLLRNYKNNRTVNFWNPGDNIKDTIKGGVICGTFLVLSVSSQQVGLKYTSIGKAGFLSTLAVMVVPLIGLALGKKVYLYQWMGIFFAIIGVGFLSLNNVSGIELGDIMLLLTSFLIAIHVIISGHYNKIVDSFQFTVIRFAWGAIMCLVFTLIFEGINIEGIKNSVYAILFAGVFGSGVAFTLMALSQRNLDNITVSIIMSLESVFAALSGWLILGQRMTVREIIGSIVVFSAVMGMQIYGEIKNRHEAIGDLF